MIFLGEEALNMLEVAFPDCTCWFEEPSGFLCISKATGTSCIQPSEETMQTLRDRIKRSQASGRNLFFEEWAKPVYDPECDY